jgi:hypothetical protein
MEPIASSPIAVSGISGMKMPTRSPFSTPRARSAAPRRATASRSSANVNRRTAPSSPSHTSASSSPRPASTCRSTQLAVALNPAPGNHCANGTPREVSTTLVHATSQRRPSRRTSRS